jgi:periplasmic protein TonB
MAEKENNKLFGDWTNVVADGRNSLVFEGKNKTYGAFELRKGYNNTVTKALIITITVAVLAVMSPQIIKWLTPAEEEVVEVPVDLSQLDMEPPPADETEPPPPPPPPPPVMETVKFTPPVVVDEELPDEEIPPPQEELAETNVGVVTQEGSGDEIIIPTEGNGNAIVEEEAPQIFVSVEEMPGFPGGEAKLFEYLGKNIQYPQMEKENGISGTVYVYFVINKQGKVQDVKVARGVKGGGGLDKEAMRVIKNMPDWSVGKQNGRPAMVQFTLPVKFVLR